MISAIDITTMFTYSHANMTLGQSKHVYYLSYFIKCYNPLSPNSDQYQFSPNYTNTLSIEKVRGISRMITKGNTLIF